MAGRTPTWFTVRNDTCCAVHVWKFYDDIVPVTLPYFLFWPVGLFFLFFTLLCKICGLVLIALFTLVAFLF